VHCQADAYIQEVQVMLTVGAVMTQAVVTVKPETSFKEAVRLLRQRRVSGLPVVDGEGNLVGIVSEADLLNKVEKRDPDAYLLESRPHRLDRARSAALDVASAMSREVTTVQPDFPVALAAREMHTRGFKRLPVVDEKGKLVGIVSRGDLLKVFLRSDRELRSDIRRILDLAQVRLGGRGLKATVSGGIVDLAGDFESKTRLEAIVRAISEIDGVVGVRSNMAFDLDDSVEDSGFSPISDRADRTTRP
jgi:CBS domain-containing protein